MFVLVVRIVFRALGTMRDSLSHSHTDLMLVVESKDFLLSFLLNIYSSIGPSQGLSSSLRQRVSDTLLITGSETTSSIQGSGDQNRVVKRSVYRGKIFT